MRLPREQRAGTFDVSGDGLPDFVYADKSGNWTVYYNTGELVSGGASVIWPAPSFGAGKWAIRMTDDSGDRTLRDLVDINGDGACPTWSTSVTVPAPGWCG